LAKQLSVIDSPSNPSHFLGLKKIRKRRDRSNNHSPRLEVSDLDTTLKKLSVQKVVFVVFEKGSDMKKKELSLLTRNTPKESCSKDSEFVLCFLVNTRSLTNDRERAYFFRESVIKVKVMVRFT
jgi:hypothetical protein